jgi:hypothetical protein
MAEEQTNLVLGHLRYVRASTDGLRDDVRQIMLRLGVIERPVANAHVSEAGIRVRLDRIERRLELADG